MGRIPINKYSLGRLEKALRPVLGDTESVGDLSQVLVRAIEKDIISYGEIKEAIKGETEEVLLETIERRLLLPIGTAKSLAWEDRMLLLKKGETYEMPNIIRYLLRDSLNSGRWETETAISRLFEEQGNPHYKQMPLLAKKIFQEAVNHRISADKIKAICLQTGLENYVDSLIAGFKAAGIISPKLGSVTEVNKEGSPIYELNPSVIF